MFKPGLVLVLRTVCDGAGPIYWRVPNPPGANPLVAERAFPTSDYWGRTEVGELWGRGLNIIFGSEIPIKSQTFFYQKTLWGGGGGKKRGEENLTNDTPPKKGFLANLFLLPSAKISGFPLFSLANQPAPYRGLF